MTPKRHLVTHVRSVMFVGALAAIAISWQQGGAKRVPAAETPPANLERYRAQVQPFLKKHCLSCHGPEKQEGKLRLDTLKAEFVSDLDANMWSEVRARLLAGEMPPKGKPKPSQAELKPVLEWLTQGLVQRDTLALRPPHEGNRVDHDLLFGADASKLPAATPAREWRISPEIYFRLLEDLDPQVQSSPRQDYILENARKGLAIRYSQAFPTGAQGFRDYSGTSTIDQPTAAVLIRNAKELAKMQTEWRVDKDGKPVLAPQTRLLLPRHPSGIPSEFLLLMNPQATPTPQQLEAAIRKQFQQVLLREPAAEELKRFLALMHKNIQDAGQIEGVRATLAAVLLLREVYFRSEVGQDAKDSHGRQLLAPREMAFAIAYALTDRRPDTELLAAAEQGKLASREAVKQQVERLLNDAKIEKPRILRFFHEYFGYTEAAQAFKDQKTAADYSRALKLKNGTYFNYRPGSLIRDTNMLVMHVLERDQNVLEELLTTNKAFINFNPSTGKELRIDHNMKYQEYFYNLEQWPAQQPVHLPADQRAGILTQPSWLVALSFNDRTDAIHRGKWVREKLLGAALNAVPGGVDATIPEDPKQTLRERLAGTKKEYCWSCHQKMNPLGLSFEMFDHFGRSRAEELGRPVDSTGSIDFSGEEKLDGPINNGVEMLKKLAQSPRVRQVFVRHAFRYWLGRAETLNDAPTLVAADRAYVASGGSMKALIAALLTSDSFLYRIGKAPQP